MSTDRQQGVRSSRCHVLAAGRGHRRVRSRRRRRLLRREVPTPARWSDPLAVHPVLGAIGLTMMWLMLAGSSSIASSRARAARRRSCRFFCLVARRASPICRACVLWVRSRFSRSRSKTGDDRSRRAFTTRSARRVSIFVSTTRSPPPPPRPRSSCSASPACSSAAQALYYMRTFIHAPQLAVKMFRTAAVLPVVHRPDFPSMWRQWLDPAGGSSRSCSARCAPSRDSRRTRSLSRSCSSAGTPTRPIDS